MKTKIFFLLFVFGVAGFFYSLSPDLQKLSKQDAFIVDSILAKTAQKLGQVKMRKENSNRLSISEFKSEFSLFFDMCYQVFQPVVNTKNIFTNERRTRVQREFY